MTSDPHARLAEFLSIGDTRQNLPGVRIRDAATMLVSDRTGHAPKVLLGRRHHGHKFMPGKYVFPGGRVEIADRRMNAATPLDKRVEARLMKEVRYPSAEKSRGFPLAAIREVFEKTGLVLGTKTDRPPTVAYHKRGKDVHEIKGLELAGSTQVVAQPFLGILPLRDDPALGVEVRHVFEKSPAEKAGLHGFQDRLGDPVPAARSAHQDIRTGRDEPSGFGRTDKLH